MLIENYTGIKKWHLDKSLSVQILKHFQAIKVAFLKTINCSFLIVNHYSVNV